MKKFKPLLITALIAAGVMALVTRVPKLRQLVIGS
jgi:hypothetical protein